jgi:hypothetical protein
LGQKREICGFLIDVLYHKVDPLFVEKINENICGGDFTYI